MTPALRPSPRRDERGATLVLAALGFVVLAIIAAIAIDLSAARNDRAANQLIADSAATAGAAALGDGGGAAGCLDALNYIATNAGATVTLADCTTFPSDCDDTTPSATTTGTVDALTVTIVHPVDDGHAVMQPGAVGAPPQAVVDPDGDRCDRFAVAITETRDTFFGDMIAIGQLTTSIHAVALYGVDDGADRAINLLVLDRHECDALTASNGAGTGGIRVGPIFDPVTGESHTGRIMVDSDATVGCNSSGAIDIDGTNAMIRADGGPGCPTETGPAGSGQGCGVIETFAPGPPGCLVPACTSSGVINPPPTQVYERLTRASVDWRFNCKDPYPVSYDIEGCPDPVNRPPYIDQLAAAIGPAGIPTGFASYTAAGYPCNIGPADNVTIPPGNWVVECNLAVRGSLTFVGGNLVLDGDLKMTSGGAVSVNNANNAVYTWTDLTPVDHTQSSKDAAYLYMRNGAISKTAQATLSLDRTTVYLASGSAISVAGGSGALSWTAPTFGPFDALALWSESAGAHDFGGQATLVMEGIFFTPFATIKYTGNGNQQQVSAQFIANKLSVGGQGLLDITPNARRAIIFPAPGPTALIR